MSPSFPPEAVPHGARLFQPQITTDRERASFRPSRIPVKLPEDRRRDPRALRIVARTLYRELRANGYDERDGMMLANELLAEVSCDIRRRTGQIP